MMIRVLNKIVGTRLIVLSLILSALIGIVDGSITIILTSISFDDAQISMGKKEVIAFIARYILLLFLTNIFSNYLSKIQLSIDTKVHTKFENASYDQLMQYTLGTIAEASVRANGGKKNSKNNYYVF